MEANIKLDEQLLNEAKQLSHIQSTEEVIKRALERYVNTLQAYRRLLDLQGKVTFWDDEDAAQTPSV